MRVISVDRPLAMLLGLRYKQIITLKRTYIIVATIWVLSHVSSLYTFLDDCITIPLCLVISLASYTKISRTHRYHQVQAEDPVQQQPSQLNVLNIAQYRKAVYSALWVKLVLVVCFAPFFIVVTVIAHNKTNSSHLVILRGITVVLVYFNSTLNPFLYCWKISEVRQAVKQTIRQALCCPWSQTILSFTRSYWYFQFKTDW